MKPAEWFTLWMTLLAGVLTFVAVFLGAWLAIAGQRRVDRRSRGGEAAQSLAEVVDRLRGAWSGVTAIGSGRDIDEEVDEVRMELTQRLSAGEAMHLTDDMLLRALSRCAATRFSNELQVEYWNYVNGVHTCLIAYASGRDYDVPWAPVLPGDPQPLR